jgi:hypothetical protein
VGGVYSIHKEVDLKLDIPLIFIKPMFASLLCSLTARNVLNIIGESVGYRLSTVLSIIVAAFVYASVLLMIGVLKKNDIRILVSRV